MRVSFRINLDTHQSTCLARMVFHWAGASIIEHAKGRKSGSHFSRSPQELGEGADRGDPGGLDRRRVDPAGRRSGAGDGVVGDQQVAGLQAVQREWTCDFF